MAVSSCVCDMLHREDIVWTLQTLNPNALELNRLWHEHGYASAVRLLDVTGPDLLERLPVKVNLCTRLPIQDMPALLYRAPAAR